MHVRKGCFISSFQYTHGVVAGFLGRTTYYHVSLLLCIYHSYEVYCNIHTESNVRENLPLINPETKPSSFSTVKFLMTEEEGYIFTDRLNFNEVYLN